MKFSAATVLALATAVLARPRFTNSNFNIEEGETFTLTWGSAVGEVTIEIMTGEPPNGLKPFRTLTTTTGPSGSFPFTPTDLPSDKYTFRISDESGDEPNYSESWNYVGSVEPSSSVTSSATVTSSAVTSTSTESSTETETETETSTSTSTETSTAVSSSTTVSTTLVPSTTRRTQVTETSSPPPNTNNGQRFASSLALVLGTVAALALFN